ncbi:hypothetical protein BGZ76_004371 [Entomortierella beljakovae]|nr:hypothetical protein BGZ76_004371 [Entomortierella beljakovae]
MGFQWVQDHIAAFSGDSEMITAMGQSAGSVSINNLLIIPQFHGLFRRAILQSGSSTLISAAHPEVEGQDIFDDLCQSLNIPADLDPLEKVSRLRNVPAKDIVEILDSNPIRFHRSMIDGVLLKQESYWASRDSRNYDRNIEWIMTGTCADEASVFSTMGAANTKEMDALKRRLCETNTESTFDSLYGTAKTNRDSVVISTTAIGDGAFFYPTLLTNEAVLSHPTCQLSRFYFDRNLDMVDKVARGGIGAFHGVEMFYIAGNEYAKKFMTEEEKGFIKDVQSVWIEFATARSPQESSLPIASKPILNDFLGISCQREQKEAIVFKKDLTVGRGDLERLTLEHAMFWWKSHSRFREYVAKGSYEAGFEYIRAGHGRPKSEVVRKVRVKSSNFVQESRL